MPHTNEDLQKDVLNAIKWEPLLHAAEIGVTAKDGIITLTGVVDSYAKKLEAETAAKNVVGVKAVVEAIEIKFDGIGEKTDNEVADDVLTALKWHWQFWSDQIKIKVEQGWVTLEGELTWNYQREAAKNAIIQVKGVKGINNEIKLKTETQDEVEKITIEQALVRSSLINAKDIQIEVNHNKVILTGKVHSFAQKNEVERIAWSAAGVEAIDNQLDIRYINEYVDSFGYYSLI
ncbi:MAG: BON domain-containing protein [Ferruginibacter sp.]